MYHLFTYGNTCTKILIWKQLVALVEKNRHIQCIYIIEHLHFKVIGYKFIKNYIDYNRDKTLSSFIILCQYKMYLCKFYPCNDSEKLLVNMDIK